MNAALAVRTAACMAALWCGCAGAGEYAPVPGGALRSVLPADAAGGAVQVPAFLLRTRLVTNAEFRAFVAATPQWQRGAVPALFAGEHYLSALADAEPDAPVTHVSWYAAQAFCGAEDARLPRWHEWEFAAAADATRADARDDPGWLAGILAWYATPASVPGRVAQGTANLYGIHDLHGLAWEWVEDFNGLFVDADGRAGGARKSLEFCGAAAASLSDRRNYAVLMRIALLAALEGNHDGGQLGFRCARDGGTR